MGLSQGIMMGDDEEQQQNGYVKKLGRENSPTDTFEKAPAVERHGFGREHVLAIVIRHTVGYGGSVSNAENTAICIWMLRMERLQENPRVDNENPSPTK